MKPQTDIQPNTTLRDLKRAGVPPAELRSALRQHACGVAIITTRTAGGPVGCTVTSFTSVSLDPPLVAFSLMRTSRSGQAWLQAEDGVVHLLHEGQHDTSRRFSSADTDHFSADVGWQWNGRALPVLDEALGWIEVETHHRIIAGDHLVILALVTRTRTTAGRPLLYHGGRYRMLDEGHPTEPTPAHTTISQSSGQPRLGRGMTRPV